MKPIFSLISLLLVLNASAQRNINVTAAIGDKTKGSITRSEIIAAGKLTLLQFDKDRKPVAPQFMIISYKVSIFALNYKPAEDMVVDGETFTAEVSDKIKTAPVGARIFIEHIKARWKDSDAESARSMPALSFELAGE